MPQRLEFLIPDATGGHRMVCWQWGAANLSRTLLCVHGLTRNGRDFDFLARALADNYCVLCPDIAGRGESDWLRNPLLYANPNYLADVGFILASLKIAQVDWIGTSMGGIMGMMMANLQPGLIKSLVLNDIGTLIPASGLARIRDIVDFPTSFSSHEEAENTLRKRCENFGIRDEEHWNHLIQYGIKNHDGRWIFTYDPAIFANGFAKDTPLVDVNLWGFWDAVTKIPVLLIRGEESDLLTSQTAEQMKATHPKLQRYEVPNTGHAPALMSKEQIDSIQSWLRKSNGAGLQ